MLRHRWVVLGVWLVVFVAAGWASSQLSDLLTNRFSLPGTDAQRAEQILEERFGQRSVGSFTLVVRTDGDAQDRVAEVQAAAERAAAELPTGRAIGAQAIGDDLVTASIVSSLE